MAAGAPVRVLWGHAAPSWTIFPCLSWRTTAYGITWSMTDRSPSARSGLSTGTSPFCYITRMGADGLVRVTEQAVLHTNYLRSRVEEHLPVPYGGLRKHEFVASAAPLKAKGVRATDVAKRLIDYGIHPPTIYFPDLVEEALMIEPTESVTREGLDAFVEALAQITEEDPERLRAAPENAAVARVDEVAAAKRPILSWRMMDR